MCIRDSLQGGFNTTYHVTAENLQLRTQLDRNMTSTLRLRAGADVMLSHYDYSETVKYDQSVTIPYPSRNDVVIGGYADVVWRVDPRIEVVPGLRFDVFTSRAEGTIR